MLENKTVIVTGSSRGIGKTIINELKQECHVCGTYCNKAPFLQGIHYQLDISDKKSIERFWEDKPKYDVLVNNAGISHRKYFLDYTYEEIQNIINTNLIGTIMMCKYFIKQNPNGTIINIASIGGVNGGTEQIPYAVSKAGIINLTKSIAKAYPSIKCNCISPGIIDTDMIDVTKINLKRIPKGRIGNTNDIAGTVKFLIDEASDYITGQNIVIDGGITINV
jgi:NAD(P)-dependent dehydrogenase (short-subunit alcohol dehydrogenase family)